jgi:hypothetical protein
LWDVEHQQIVIRWRWPDGMRVTEREFEMPGQPVSAQHHTTEPLMVSKLTDFLQPQPKAIDLAALRQVSHWTGNTQMRDSHASLLVEFTDIYHNPLSFP